MDILEDNIRHAIIADHNCIFVVDGVGDLTVDGYEVIDYKGTLEGSKITIAVGEPSTQENATRKSSPTKASTVVRNISVCVCLQ